MASLFRKNTDEKVPLTEAEIDLEVINNSRKEPIMSDGNITTLTADVEFKGTIKFDKIMKIDGKFDGEVITKDGELIIGKTGSVKANIKVKNAIIDGRLDGNIVAFEKVELKQKAQLIGDLQAKTLVIDEGVVFVGKCNVNPAGVNIDKHHDKQNFNKEKREKD